MKLLSSASFLFAGLQAKDLLTAEGLLYAGGLGTKCLELIYTPIVAEPPRFCDGRLDNLEDSNRKTRLQTKCDAWQAAQDELEAEQTARRRRRRQTVDIITAINNNFNLTIEELQELLPNNEFLNSPNIDGSPKTSENFAIANPAKFIAQLSDEDWNSLKQTLMNSGPALRMNVDMLDKWKNQYLAELQASSGANAACTNAQLMFTDSCKNVDDGNYAEANKWSIAYDNENDPTSFKLETQHPECPGFSVKVSFTQHVYGKRKSGDEWPKTLQKIHLGMAQNNAASNFKYLNNKIQWHLDGGDDANQAVGTKYENGVVVMGIDPYNQFHNMGVTKRFCQVQWSLADNPVVPTDDMPAIMVLENNLVKSQFGSSCNGDYFLDTVSGQCVQKNCVCSNGTPLSGDACPESTDPTESCVSCDVDYDLVLNPDTNNYLCQKDGAIKFESWTTGDTDRHYLLLGGVKIQIHKEYDLKLKFKAAFQTLPTLALNNYIGLLSIAGINDKLMNPAIHLVGGSDGGFAEGSTSITKRLLISQGDNTKANKQQSYFIDFDNLCDGEMHEIRIFLSMNGSNKRDFRVFYDKNEIFSHTRSAKDMIDTDKTPEMYIYQGSPYSQYPTLGGAEAGFNQIIVELKEYTGIPIGYTEL